jgi:hypothetical protein
LTLILIAHALDLLTFIPAVGMYGIGGEGNPLARFAYDTAGLPGVMALKVTGVALALWMLAGVTDSPAKGIAIAIVAAFGFLGAASNLYAITR